nr:uncharacterized protein LOC123572444 [Macaca fascicularis]
MLFPGPRRPPSLLASSSLFSGSSQQGPSDNPLHFPNQHPAACLLVSYWNVCSHGRDFPTALLRWIPSAWNYSGAFGVGMRPCPGDIMNWWGRVSSFQMFGCGFCDLWVWFLHGRSRCQRPLTGEGAVWGQPRAFPGVRSPSSPLSVLTMGSVLPRVLPSRDGASCSPLPRVLPSRDGASSAPLPSPSSFSVDTSHRYPGIRSQSLRRGQQLCRLCVGFCQHAVLCPTPAERPVGVAGGGKLGLQPSGLWNSVAAAPENECIFLHLLRAKTGWAQRLMPGIPALQEAEAGGSPKCSGSHNLTMGTP